MFPSPVYPILRSFSSNASHTRPPLEEREIILLYVQANFHRFLFCFYFSGCPSPDHHRPIDGAHCHYTDDVHTADAALGELHQGDRRLDGGVLALCFRRLPGIRRSECYGPSESDLTCLVEPTKAQAQDWSQTTSVLGIRSRV